MKKLTLSLIVSASICSIVANAENLNTTMQNKMQTPPPLVEDTSEKEPIYFGYNYIGFGSETATYKENGVRDGINFKSSATTTSPVYISGGLIKINKYFDFSIDAASTMTYSPTQGSGYLGYKSNFN